MTRRRRMSDAEREEIQALRAKIAQWVEDDPDGALADIVGTHNDFQTASFHTAEAQEELEADDASNLPMRQHFIDSTMNSAETKLNHARDTVEETRRKRGWWL